MTDSKKNSGTMSAPYASSEPKMIVNIKGMENHIFYYGKDMQAKCIQSSKAFLDYVGRTYGESERQSIIINNLVITEMEEPMYIATKSDFDKMSLKDQRLWDKKVDNWSKISVMINKNLSKAYSVLWALCHPGLQQKIMEIREV